MYCTAHKSHLRGPFFGCKTIESQREWVVMSWTLTIERILFPNFLNIGRERDMSKGPSNHELLGRKLTINVRMCFQLNSDEAVFNFSKCLHWLLLDRHTWNHYHNYRASTSRRQIYLCQSFWGQNCHLFLKKKSNFMMPILYRHAHDVGTNKCFCCPRKVLNIFAAWG